MRKLLVLALVLGLVGVAAANDLGNRAPVKATGTFPENIPNPIRQGGDTIFDATVIPAMPYSNSGTTTGFTNDYSGSCVGGSAPDVVYVYTPASNELLDIMLCGSAYDTGLIVFDAAMTQIGCNDDFCGLQSGLQGVPVVAGNTYYIIVDGYSTQHGSYVIDIVSFIDEPCIITCTGVDEGEVDMYDDYDDEYNGGCNSDSYRFQALVGDPDGNLTLCGNSGWYFFAGTNYRDTDWFSFVFGATGTVELEYVGEEDLWLYDLTTGLNCDSASGFSGPTSTHCNSAFYTFTGAPGSVKTIVILPPAWEPITATWDYQLNFTGLAEGPVATEGTTWGNLKAMYQ